MVSRKMNVGELLVGSRGSYSKRCVAVYADPAVLIIINTFACELKAGWGKDGALQGQRYVFRFTPAPDHSYSSSRPWHAYSFTPPTVTQY